MARICATGGSKARKGLLQLRNTATGRGLCPREAVAWLPVTRLDLPFCHLHRRRACTIPGIGCATVQSSLDFLHRHETTFLRMSILVIGNRAPTEYAAIERELSGEHRVVVAADAVAAGGLLRERRWALVVLDDDPAALPGVLEQAGAAPVVMVLTRPSLRATLDALEAGARDVHAPPLRADRLRDLAARGEVVTEERRAEPEPASSLIVGESPAMLDVYRSLARAAASEQPVLFVGEAGTGKELLARVVHERSSRSGGPFVAVNCAAIPGHLLEAELFGDVEGTVSGKLGWFARAAGGTLYLEEIGSLPGALQVRLHQVVQRGHPGAGGTPDVRVIAASDADLQDAVLRQRFRGDLYYLLAAIRIDVPPLRDRGGDVALIARQMLNELAGGRLGAIRDIEPAALEALQRYTWPGNLRQLRAVLSRALAIADGPMLRVSHLPAEIVEPASARRPMAGEFLTLAELERLHIEEALALTGGHLGQAARLLGIHRNTLRRKLEAYQLPGK